MASREHPLLSMASHFDQVEIYELDIICFSRIVNFRVTMMFSAKKSRDLLGQFAISR